MYILDQTTLRSLVHYDPESGDFFWKVRLGTDRITKVFNTQFSGKKVKSFTRRDGYLCFDISIAGQKRKFAAHRLAWLYVHGAFPDAEIDHINRVKTDNRLSNLRAATSVQNSHNIAPGRRNKSGVKGVYWDKDRCKWAADLQIGEKRFRLGRFDSLQEAQGAYAVAAREHVGDFAFLGDLPLSTPAAT